MPSTTSCWLARWNGPATTIATRSPPPAFATPRSAAILIRLAQRAERDGDLANAERYLSAAADIDRTFDPPWALANFYFRTDDYSRFWTWIRISMERAYGDGQALFDLCARVPDGERRALALLPRDADSLVRYLRYLLSRETTGPVAGSVAEELARRGPDPRIATCC